VVELAGLAELAGRRGGERGSGERAEELAEVGGEEVGGLEAGEVAAAVELRPADHVADLVNSLDELALHVAVKGFDFQVLQPPELIPVLHALSGRLRDAAAAS
jgi:hypothetical protein